MEQEFKYQLRAEDYAVIIQVFLDQLGEPKVLRQANHFFDTDDGQLQVRGMAVRLRQQNERFLLTCKWGRKTDGALSSVQEFEQSVTPEQANLMLHGSVPVALPLAPEVQQVLRAEEGSLVLRAGFTNKRMCWFTDGIEIALDHADIGGQEEYELELELQGGDLAAAEKLANVAVQAGAVLKPQPKSKLERLKERRPDAFR